MPGLKLGQSVGIQAVTQPTRAPDMVSITCDPPYIMVILLDD